MRTFTVSEAADLDTIGRSLLTARLGKARTAAALESLRAANPHAAEGRLARGAVIFVPEAPGLARDAGTPADAGLRDDLRAMMTAALAGAAEEFAAALDARAAERKEAGAALESPAIRRLARADQDLARQIELAAKTLAAEETDDAAAAQALEALRTGAAAALAELGGDAGRRTRRAPPG